MTERPFQPRLWLALASTAVVLAACSDAGSSSGETVASAKPNILFIVLDDVGVDQMTAYDYGGAMPPNTPNMNAIAQAGVLFRNAWAMPDCTTTRATFFTGRYPSQTNVLNAVVSADLANSSTSPLEMTLPKLLKAQGYTNALIGKMHLTGSDLNDSYNLPYGYDTMWKMGWDYFDGFLDGAPYNIDTRAGLSTNGATVDDGPYQCGFIPNTQDGSAAAPGADTGACYFADNSCTVLSTTDGIVTPGRTCMERGGILVPNASCQATVPANVDFTAQNGYYTGRWVKSTQHGHGQVFPAYDMSSRGYRSILETDRALAWAAQQSGDQPWMLTVGYSAVHTPLQLPPTALVDTEPPALSLSCSPRSVGDGSPLQTLVDLGTDRAVTNLMLEAMDTKIGDLLVGLGLARYKTDGTLDYHPEQTNTVVVIMGDNGTYVNSVKALSPGMFDPTRAKASSYQTGVWVPLLVAGPMVAAPGREVPHMVGSVDLYQLFAEIAGADPTTGIPDSQTLDAQPMLAYLRNPDQGPIRTSNFTEMGTNLRSAAVQAEESPCVIESANNVCTTLFPQKGICEAQSGLWYGENPSSGIGGTIPAGGYHNCCQVQAHRTYEESGKETTFLPASTKAVTDGTYKLVRQTRYLCNPPMGDITTPANFLTYQYSTTDFDIRDELYAIDTAVPDPMIDKDGSELIASTAPPLDVSTLPLAQQQAYNRLKTEMARHDQVANYNWAYDTSTCPGDGNHDGVVDQLDVANWQELSILNDGQSSWYDFNHDGKTDIDDKGIINQYLGNVCPGA